ncbi:MAG: hypothetical protein J6B46_00360, partial [Parabacteroides sp.]|nr:hypothetical protein [Parabacteroides sp.]
QSIISALEKNVYISEVEKLTDGYILHFTDGTTATIKNGTNGLNGKDAPVINVKQENGVYYWTITVDGETTWLTDDKGNKLPVSGTDGENGTNGKNGVTPLLKVDGDGYWMVSYDNGSSYTYVLDSYGHKVYAVGPQGPAGVDGTNGTNGSQGSQGEPGDSKFLNVEVKDGNVIITLNDTNKTQIIIPIAAGVSYTMDGEPVSNLNEIALNAEGEATVLKYEISTMSNATVEVLSEKGVKVSVEGNTISITRDTESNISIRDSKVVLLYYNDEQTLTSVLKFKEAWIVETDDDGNEKKVRVNSEYYTTIEEALSKNNNKSDITIELADDDELDIADFNSTENKTITIIGESKEGTVLNMNEAIYISQSKFTFKNLTISIAQLKYEDEKTYGAMYRTAELNLENCNIKGCLCLCGYGTTNISNCTFTNTFGSGFNGYGIFYYGYDQSIVNVSNCTFDMISKAIVIYNHSTETNSINYTLNVEGCTFNASKTDDKAAVQMHTERGSIYGTVNIKNCSATGFITKNNGLWNEVNNNNQTETYKFDIYVDGTLVHESEVSNND